MQTAQGKPQWSQHNWPHIFQNERGHWFGVRDGWTMQIVKEFKGDSVWLLREDGEFLGFGDPSPHWHESLESRPSTH